MAPDSNSEITAKLLDKEAEDIKKHREKIGRISLEIEQIVLKEGLNVGDFLEIVGLFVERSNRVFEKITIKEIKEKYERPN